MASATPQHLALPILPPPPLSSSSEVKEAEQPPPPPRRPPLVIRQPSPHSRARPLHPPLRPLLPYFKTSRQIFWQLRLEYALLRHDWPLILGFIFVQYLHLVSRNLVYFIQGRVYHYPHQGNNTSHNNKSPPAVFPYPPVKDLGFMAFDGGSLLPQSLEWLTTFFMASLGVLMVLLWVARIVLNIQFGGPKTSLTGRDAEDRRLLIFPVPLTLIVKRMAMAGIIVIPLRCLTFLVTLLPPPNPHCQSAWSPPTSLQPVFNPLESPRPGCGDLMFSGHFFHGTLITLMVGRYFPAVRGVLLLAIGALVALGFSLITFLQHYSADVLAAAYVTVGAWFLLPKEPETLREKYGVGLNVRVRPNYLTAGTDLWRGREVLTGLEEGGELVGEEVEEEEEEGVEVEEGGMVGLCWMCGQQLRRGIVGERAARRRGRRRRRLVYVAPLPPSFPPLVEYRDNTASERVMERLPW